MIATDPLAAAHQRACNALDLARESDNSVVVDRLQSATINIWYALKSSADTRARLDAAEEQVTAAMQDADDEIVASLRAVRDLLQAVAGGDER